MHEPEHRPWLLDVVRLLVGLAGLFFIVGSLGAFDLHALAEDGAEPNPVLFALGWVLLCIAFLSVAERSFSFLDRVKMVVKPIA
jgi:hypothetical protein